MFKTSKKDKKELNSLQELINVNRFLPPKELQALPVPGVLEETDVKMVITRKTNTMTFKTQHWTFVFSEELYPSVQVCPPLHFRLICCQDLTAPPFNPLDYRDSR